MIGQHYREFEKPGKKFCAMNASTQWLFICAYYLNCLSSVFYNCNHGVYTTGRWDFSALDDRVSTFQDAESFCNYIFKCCFMFALFISFCRFKIIGFSFVSSHFNTFLLLKWRLLCCTRAFDPSSWVFAYNRLLRIFSAILCLNIWQTF